jgi:hypothetical protein
MAALIRLGINTRLNRIEQAVERMAARPVVYRQPALLAPDVLGCYGWLAWSYAVHTSTLNAALNRYAWLLGELNDNYRLAKQHDRDALEAYLNTLSWGGLLDQDARHFCGVIAFDEWNGPKHLAAIAQTRTQLAATQLYQDVVPDTVWDTILTVADGGAHVSA